MPARSSMALVSTALPIVVLVRVERASNGVVCAAAPSYDCSPTKVTFGNESINCASSTAGWPGVIPVRPKNRSTASLIGSRRVPAASLMSRTFCRSSTTNMVSGALSASATARSILCLPITAVVISSPGMPDSAKTSASLSRAAQQPMAPALSSARATSGHLWVLPCGRKALFLALRCEAIFAMLSSKASRSRSRAGVGTSPRNCIRHRRDASTSSSTYRSRSA